MFHPSQIHRTLGILLFFCLSAGGSLAQPAIDLSGLEALAKEAESATAMPERMEARCMKVLAGDRIDALVASGNTMKILYLGVKLPNPESPDPAIRALYQKALGLNKQLVENQLVTLEFENLEPDKGGRFAAYVFCGKTFVNAELVRQGLAKVEETEFQLKRFLEKKQALAQEERLGIWALEPPAPPVETGPPTHGRTKPRGLRTLLRRLAKLPGVSSSELRVGEENQGKESGHTQLSRGGSGFRPSTMQTMQSLKNRSKGARLQRGKAQSLSHPIHPFSPTSA
jgi:endonuclease YncB( thermonuclease family)